MTNETLIWLAAIACGSQLLACLFMDLLHRRREHWSRRQGLRFELSSEVQRIQIQRAQREANMCAEATMLEIRKMQAENNG